MLATFINLIILIAILFFPSRALWNYINKKNHIAQAAIKAANQIEENTSQLTYEKQEQNLSENELKEEGLFFAPIDAAHEIKLLAEQQQNNSLERPEAKLSREQLITQNTTQTSNINQKTSSNTDNQVADPKQNPEDKTYRSSPAAANYASSKSHQKHTSKASSIEFYAGPQKYEIHFGQNNSVTYKPSSQNGSLVNQKEKNNYYSQINSAKGEIIHIGEEGRGIPVHKASISSAAAKSAQEIMVEINNNYSEIPPPQPQYVVHNETIIASIPSPIPELSYDLSSLDSNGRDFRVIWHIRNNTAKPIQLDGRLRNILSPTQLYLVDVHSQRRLPIRYDREIPIANCLLVDQILPFGRIECSAQVGLPSYISNLGIMGNRVLVYLPNSQSPIRIFANLL